MRGLILLDTQAGVEDPAIAAGYDQMRDIWLTVGPVDELADVVANIIIADPAVNPVVDRQVAGPRRRSSSRSRTSR